MNHIQGVAPVTNVAQTRVILLGASNLTRGISTVVGLSQQMFTGPLEIYTALGHGRSYGKTSRALGRELPGINQCALWQALADRESLPTYALVTDIGNDLFYGASLDQLTAWIDLALTRLAALDARTVVTLLPTGTADHISARRFRWLRSLMFPSCRLELNELQQLIVELNARLRELARSHRACAVEQRADWYGFDPIHIARARWSVAWTEILRNWNDDSKNIFQVSASLRRWFYLRSRAPHLRVLWGIAQRTMQPAARLSDGTTVAIY